MIASLRWPSLDAPCCTPFTPSEQLHTLIFIGHADGANGHGGTGQAPYKTILSPLGQCRPEAHSVHNEDALAFLPTDLPPSVHALHLQGSAVSRHGVRLLGAARPPALRTLSLAKAGLRGADLAPIFKWLSSSPCVPPAF